MFRDLEGEAWRLWGEVSEAGLGRFTRASGDAAALASASAPSSSSSHTGTFDEALVQREVSLITPSRAATSRPVADAVSRARKRLKSAATSPSSRTKFLSWNTTGASS